MRRVQRNPGRLVYLILELICLIFIFIGFFLLKNNTDFKKDSLETSGVITNIERVRSGDNVRHIVDVQYIIDGKSYEKELGYYSSSMYEGQTITLIYHPDTPMDARIVGSNVFYIMFMCMGGVFFIFILCFSIIAKRQRRRNNI